jgi:hypothetical protein
MILKSIKNFLRIINKKCKKIQIENRNQVDQKVVKDMIQIYKIKKLILKRMEIIILILDKIISKMKMHNFKIRLIIKFKPKKLKHKANTIIYQLIIIFKLKA